MSQRKEGEAEIKQVYEAVLGVGDEVRTLLAGVSDKIKEAINGILTDHYQENAKLMKALAADPMNPMLAQQAGENVRPYVEALHEVHKQVSETNAQIPKISLQLGLVGGTMDVSFAKRIQEGQQKILAQSYQVNKVAQEAQKLFQAHAMLTGDAGKLSPAQVAEQKKALDAKLAEFALLSKELKASVKDQNKLVSDATQDAPRRPGPGRSG